MEIDNSLFSLKRSLRLLYWVFFKPITLERYCRPLELEFYPVSRSSISELIYSLQVNPILRCIAMDVSLSLCIGALISALTGVFLGKLAYIVPDNVPLVQHWSLD